MMNMIIRLWIIHCLCVVLCLCTDIHRNSCEQQCSAAKSGFKGPKELHDVHCHRGCRFYRIVYMLSNPFLEHQNFIGDCGKSCKDAYSDPNSQQSCISGCTIQQNRFSKSRNLHEQLSVMQKQSEHIQHMQQHLALFGIMKLDHSIKRLCSWTLISSHNRPGILIVRTDQAPAPGHMLMSDVTAQHEELQLGGARPGLMRDSPVEKKKNDLWWVCVIERTLQPLMAGLLLLSILILLWLCFTSSKETTTTNAKQLIVPNEMGKLKFQVHSPQCVEPSDEKKTPLLNMSLQDV